MNIFKKFIFGVVFCSGISGNILLCDEQSSSTKEQQCDKRQNQKYLFKSREEVIREVASLGYGAACGVLFTTMWEFTNGYELPKIFASGVLAAAPILIAREKGTSLIQAEVMMITAAVVSLVVSNNVVSNNAE